ncbi:MAG: cobalt-precorrin-5B (C(1))-methyltransferase CbiD [Lachnospiraceae bacterium]|nr:cobalt-precorrin-5B (C(1))-methyltransferase CbiD [Lachnospiraceae bacterium]
MKKGFTTGSCAAAAAKAAAFMLLSGQKKEQITIDTPAGIRYCPKIEQIEMTDVYVSCGVRKEAGDDPDVTDKALIVAKVSVSELSGGGNDASGDASGDAADDTGSRVIIDGGKGVGRVTRPGLDQPVGNAAINSVPRSMIEKEVSEVMEIFDFEGTLAVEISVPGGEELAAGTFNPRLGIEGGISVIGTSGIVEPMSTQALLDTIRVELKQKKAMGAKIAVVSPGNYGLDFMKETYDFDLDKAVKCSNFIGQTIDMAVETGFDRLLLCGHVGKLIKVSGGIMNTHSKEADCRMELLSAAAIRNGAGTDLVSEVLSCVSTEEALEILKREDLIPPCFEYIMERISFFLNKRAGGRLQAECLVYSNRFGLLGKTKEAEAFLERAKE